jgi:hypothetical protein
MITRHGIVVTVDILAEALKQVYLEVEMAEDLNEACLLDAAHLLAKLEAL